MCINTLRGIWSVILSAHRSASEVSVGVETTAGTDNRMNGITQGVVHRKVYHQIVVTAVGGTQVLCVNALTIIWTVILSAHRTAARMSVGVETGTGTDDGMDGVAQSVVHSKVNHQIVETAVGSTEILCVNALTIIGTVVLSAHRIATRMSVGVETGSSTDNGMYGVTQGVRDSQVYENKVAVI